MYFSGRAFKKVEVGKQKNRSAKADIEPMSEERWKISTCNQAKWSILC